MRDTSKVLCDPHEKECVEKLLKTQMHFIFHLNFIFDLFVVSICIIFLSDYLSEVSLEHILMEVHG